MKLHPKSYLKFRHNQDGSVAIIFALSIIPAMLLVGGAIDFGRAYSLRDKLQSAADSAVIAAASMPSSAVASERINAAKTTFNANLSGNIGAIPAVSVNGGTITLNASADLATHFLSLAQIEKLTIRAAASASSSSPNQPICMLALDPESTDGIHIQGANVVKYPGCWAQTNSIKATAINANGSNATATGAGHCAVGGYAADHNNFSPTPQAGCAVVNDPFATVSAYNQPSSSYKPTFTPPALAATCKASNLSLKKGTYTLDPGRYCGGIDIKAQATVVFNPGVYVIDNGLFNIQSGASVSGSNLLFYYSGANSRMTIIGGGTVNFKGRNTGSSYEGFLMIAHPDAWRGLESNIQGGGTFNMEGMVYMPTQRILVSGNGDLNGSSKNFGIVAKDFYFQGNGTFNFKVRDGSSTLPDLMPKTSIQYVKLSS